MKGLRLFIIGLSVVFMAACGQGDSQPETPQQDSPNHVGQFEAVTQDGDAFNVADLEGKWWVADFVFTNCTTVCIPMTANMGELQNLLTDEGLDDVQLVSFSVDPDRDTPEVLAEYAEENGADLDRWTFLTGYEFEEIEEYSIDTFSNWVALPQDGSDQIEHMTRFFLVNPDGYIETHYSGTETEEMQDIVEEIKRLK